VVVEGVEVQEVVEVAAVHAFLVHLDYQGQDRQDLHKIELVQRSHYSCAKEKPL